MQLETPKCSDRPSLRSTTAKRMLPDHNGETADLASMAAIAAIMSNQFRHTIEHIRQQATSATASRTDVRETHAIAEARSKAFCKTKQGS